ncbi:hypothetical protein [Aeromicrobium sp. CTD01-1L150]|uniref:hypothetical protein n=1 Tax=Aeromicrobium sp. CTD01-1L150 TaxID=3341830 RepID=UPI0035C0D718
MTTPERPHTGQPHTDQPHTDQPHTGRVRVTSPLADAPAAQRRSARQEIAESTTVGTVYVRSLVRAQRRAAIVTSALAIVTIGVLPVLFWSDVAVRSWHVGPVPLVWVVLGAGVYPWVWWLGRANVARVERNESTFGSLMDSPTDPPSPPR